MYETFFGFAERPFAVTPMAKRYFAGAAIELARQTLARCTQRAEGIGLLTGPAGTGKTLLCHVLAEQFRGQMEVALLASGRLCTRRSLLQAILFELGLPYRELEEGDARMSLIDHLSPRGIAADAVPGLLLIVDEAHTLPLRLLEELRLITNLIRGSQQRVRLILAGGPQLEERFASPKLESFNQRVAARCYLEAFDRAQTLEYVRLQVESAGGTIDRVFTDDAVEAVYHATDGIPRLINQVCDHALLLACAGGVQPLTGAGIEEAWSDLQQLPTPWNVSQGAPAAAGTSGVVEFGHLDDELTDDLPAAVPFRSSNASSIANQEMPPLERLQQITAQLARIDEVQTSQSDEDFQPAGSIGPELELVFQSGANPFQGTFDEEEVVIDRYTSLESDALAHRPLVRSAESREIGSMLAQAGAPSKPIAAIAPATWPGGNPEAIRAINEIIAPRQSTAADELKTTTTGAIEVSSSPDLRPLAAGESPWAFETVSASAPATSFPIALLAPTWPIEALAPPEQMLAKTARTWELDGDENLIIVEDAPEASVSVATKGRISARRKEYRQLFAQLRRGHTAPSP